MKPTISIHIKVPVAVKAALQKAAAKDGRSLSNLATKVLCDWMTSYDR